MESLVTYRICRWRVAMRRRSPATPMPRRLTRSSRRTCKARGGVEKLKAMTSAKITGDVDQRGTKIHIVTWAKRPNYMRREMDATPPPPTPGRASIPGTTGPMKAVVASDGTHVWMINPMMGGGAAGDHRSAGRRGQGGRRLRQRAPRLQGEGTTIELIGTEPIDGKPAYHLKITKKSGLVQDYYLDVDTGLEVRTASEVDAGRRTRRRSRPTCRTIGRSTV